MKCLTFSLLHSWIRMQIQLIKISADPDPQHCFFAFLSGLFLSTWILIQSGSGMRNTELECSVPILYFWLFVLGTGFVSPRFCSGVSSTILNPQDGYLRGGRCWKAVQQPLLWQPSTMQQLQWARQVVVFTLFPFLTVILKCKHTRK